MKAKFVSARCRYILAIALFAFAAPAWSTEHSTPIQNRQKVIEKAATLNSPIEITEIKIRQKSIEAGTNFDGDEDWLAALSLNVKNSSDKAIVYLTINFNFPETRSTGDMMSYPF